MTTFIKGKLKKSERQTNIDNFRVAAHKILQNIYLGSKISIYYVVKKTEKKKQNTSYEHT